MEHLVEYLIVVNIIGVAAMGIDKYKAIHHKWRIAEKDLFFISVIGGSVGTWLGMYLFSHKIRHRKFVIGMPMVLVIQIIIATIIIMYI